MKVAKHGNRVTLKRERDEPRVKNESDLWFRLRNTLVERGEDIIKKEMSKDGHMISDNVFYVRTRKLGRPGSYGIYDPYYATRDAAKAFNQGSVELNIWNAEESR